MGVVISKDTCPMGVVISKDKCPMGVVISKDRRPMGVVISTICVLLLELKIRMHMYTSSQENGRWS